MWELRDAEDDWRAFCRERAQAPGAVSRADAGKLDVLAHSVTEAVRAWRTTMAALDLAASTRFDARRAGLIVLETVFDEVLEPPAWRLLSAYHTLAWTSL